MADFIGEANIVPCEITSVSDDVAEVSVAGYGCKVPSRGLSARSRHHGRATISCPGSTRPTGSRRKSSNRPTSVSAWNTPIRAAFGEIFAIQDNVHSPFEAGENVRLGFASSRTRIDPQRLIRGPPVARARSTIGGAGTDQPAEFAWCACPGRLSSLRVVQMHCVSPETVPRANSSRIESDTVEVHCSSRSPDLVTRFRHRTEFQTNCDPGAGRATIRMPRQGHRESPGSRAFASRLSPNGHPLVPIETRGP